MSSLYAFGSTFANLVSFSFSHAANWFSVHPLSIGPSGIGFSGIGFSGIGFSGIGFLGIGIAQSLLMVCVTIPLFYYLLYAVNVIDSNSLFPGRRMVAALEEEITRNCCAAQVT
jgi:hypothetical protein